MKKQEEKSGKMKYILLIIIIIGIISFLYARFISTRGLLIKEYAIKSSELPAEYNGFKIVHFSDLHYGSTIGIKELKTIVKRINDQKPDIVVFTGDLIEEGVKLSENEIQDIIKELNKINPTIETLCVIGNHDYDHNYWNLIIPNTNWKQLDNTYEYVYKDSKIPLVFTGLDDLTNGEPDYDNAFSFLNETENNLYTIALIHEPDQIDKIKYDTDLVLAGHSHLGQVRLPLIGAIYTPIGSKKYYDEHYILKDTEMYINGGIGTSLLKVRFFCKPSINLYRFYTK